MQLSIENQKNTYASINNLETQIVQISKKLDDQQRGAFNGNTQTNPKEHCGSVMTRSDKVSKNSENIEP